MSVFLAPRRAPQPEQRAAFAPVVGPPPAWDWPQSFATVDLSGAESAYQRVAVHASVDYLVNKATSLPIDVYMGKGDDQREMPLPSWLLDPAGDGYGWKDWLGQLIRSAALRGNVYGLPGDPDPRNALPRRLPLVHPDNVTGWRDRETGLPVWRVGGQVLDGPMWHQRRYVAPGSLLGLSPVAQHALTIGLGIQTERFGSQLFSDGAMPTGVLLNEEQAIGQKAAKVAKNRFMAALRGTREPLVLGKGWKWQQLSISPNESQFLESLGYNGAECCRIFGPHLAQLLGYPTGESMTYANRVDIQTSVVTDTLDPWLTWGEDFVSRTLLPSAWYMKFNRNALVRADLDRRFAAYKTAIEAGWMTVDEVRALEDWPKLTEAQKAEILAAKPQPGAAAAPPPEPTS